MGGYVELRLNMHLHETGGHGRFEILCGMKGGAGPAGHGQLFKRKISAKLARCCTDLGE